MNKLFNIEKIFFNDSQKKLIEKINDNFNKLELLSSSNMGIRGLKGREGPIGLPGPMGETGERGERGTKWFIGEESPIGGMGDTILPGDFWINFSEEFDPIYRFNFDKWEKTPFNFSEESHFKKIENINGITGMNAVVYNKPSSENSFHFSDIILNQKNANIEDAMTIISKKSSEPYNLLEFSRGDLISNNKLNYLKNPFFNYRINELEEDELILKVPQDSLKIQTLDKSGLYPHNINLIAYKDIKFKAGRNVALKSGVTLGKKIQIWGNSISFSGQGNTFFDFNNIYSDKIYLNKINLRSKLIFNNINKNNRIIINSKIDRSSTGEKAFKVLLKGENLSAFEQNSRYKNFSILFTDPSKNNIFSISSGNSINILRESKKTNILNNPKIKKIIDFDQVNYNWYMFNNIHKDSLGNPTLIANDYNEVIIDVPTTNKFNKIAVGISMRDSYGISYLENLKNIGDYITINIRLSNPDNRIERIGMLDKYILKYADLDKPSNSIEFKIIKSSFGYGGNYIYYLSGTGFSGYWQTVN